MIKRMLIMLVCASVLFGGIFGYKAFTYRMMQKGMRARHMPPVTVSTTTAGIQDWQPELSAVGTVRAVQGVDITTEIDGMVRTLFFKSGDDVQRGQVLAQLNADADKAFLHSLEAEAGLARSTYRRDEQQFRLKAISRAALDVSAAALKSREAQVKQQDAVVEKKTIRAPFSGRIGISTVTPGQYLHAGDAIVTLQSFDTVYVDFLLPQQNIAQIALGQTVSVATDSYPGRTFEGRITAIDPKVDPQTRNIKIEATLANPKHELVPGAFVSVQVQAGQPQRHITLPQTAITYNPYGETVYIVEKGKTGATGPPGLIARQTFVTVGDTRGDQVAILKGIKVGDTVVTAGQLKLRSGSSVTINNEIQPSNEAAPQPVDQ